MLSLAHRSSLVSFFFFFNDTATTEIYTLSLHDALPIFSLREFTNTAFNQHHGIQSTERFGIDRKSTRLNSSHLVISYAVFCLKKKKIKQNIITCNVVIISILHILYMSCST